MEKISPCRCGAVPYFTPYEQSTDGNHDTPASVTCHACGRKTIMDWDLWREVGEEFGDEKYAKPTAYLSERFIDALGDATIRKWNRENGGESCEFCEHCLYIGEGDFWCDESKEIIASEFAIHGSETCEKYREVSK